MDTFGAAKADVGKDPVPGLTNTPSASHRQIGVSPRSTTDDAVAKNHSFGLVSYHWIRAGCLARWVARAKGILHPLRDAAPKVVNAKLGYIS